MDRSQSSALVVRFIALPVSAVGSLIPYVCGAIERQLDFPLGPKTSRQPLNQNPTDYQATAFRHLSGPPSLRDQVNGGNIPPRSQTGRGGV